MVSVLELALGLSVALAVVALALARPVAWLQASVFFVVLGPFASRMWTPLSSADEFAIFLTAVVAVVRFVVTPDGLRVRTFPGGIWFLLFGISGLWSGVILDAPPALVWSGAVLALKSVVYGWAAAQYRIDRATLTRLGTSTWVAVVGVLTTSALLNLLFPAMWFERFSIGGGSERGGIASPVGALVHPGYLAQASALLLICLVAAALVGVRLPGPRAVVAALLFAILVSTLRRKAIVGLVVATAASVLVARRRRSTTLVLLVGGLIVVGALAGPSILEAYRETTRAYVINSGTSPRVLLYQGALDLANQHLPFGVGFGQYGSAVAVENYSQVYYQLGFDGVYGLAKGDQYGQDAFWPAVLGEAGWIGLICYSFGLLSVLMWFYRTARKGNSDLLCSFIGLVGVMWWFEYLVESVASPVYLAAPLGPLLFLLCGIGVAVMSTDPAGRIAPKAVEPIPGRRDGLSVRRDAPGSV